MRMRSAGFATGALLALAAPALASGSGSSALREGALPATALSASVSTEAGSWTETASMSVARGTLTATLLGNGRVLVVGGAQEFTTELYDPPTGTWIPGGTLNVPRWLHAAVRLGDGRLLVAGGGAYTPTAELYDPATNRWTPTGSMSVDRYDFTATLLRDGRVLVVGGYSLSSAGRSTALQSCTTRRAAAGRRPAASERPAATTRRRCCPTARSWSRAGSIRTAGCEARSSTTPPAVAGAAPRR